MERQSIDYTIPRCEKYELFSSKDTLEFIRTDIVHRHVKAQGIMEKWKSCIPISWNFEQTKEIKGLEKVDGMGFYPKGSDAGIDLSEVLPEESRQLLGSLICIK